MIESVPSPQVAVVSTIQVTTRQQTEAPATTPTDTTLVAIQSASKNSEPTSFLSSIDGAGRAVLAYNDEATRLEAQGKQGEADRVRAEGRGKAATYGEAIQDGLQTRINLGIATDEDFSAADKYFADIAQMKQLYNDELARKLSEMRQDCQSLHQTWQSSSKASNSNDAGTDAKIDQANKRYIGINDSSVDTVPMQD